VILELHKRTVHCVCLVLGLLLVYV